MVQLKQVVMRLKSIKNIQKITKTMKMVSASKFTKAERELKAARPFGYGPRKFYASSHLVLPESKSEKEKVASAAEPTPPPEVKIPEGGRKKKKVYVVMTSDRGLCGGVHSGLVRKLRRNFAQIKAVDEAPQHKLVCVGDKSRSMLRRQFSKNMLVSAKEIGRTSPVFSDASVLAAAIAESSYNYDSGDIYYNKYHTPVKYVQSVVPFFSKANIVVAPKIHIFDDIEDDELECYAEWTLAALLYYVMKECAASEQSARMSAMESATKNAGDMISKLTLLFNRTRQAVITRELIEIISGAAALK